MLNIDIVPGLYKKSHQLFAKARSDPVYCLHHKYTIGPIVVFAISEENVCLDYKKNSPAFCAQTSSKVEDLCMCYWGINGIF
jgi:hypothetical protein